MNLEELKNPEHNIINITKTRRLRLFRMMQPPRPVDRNIRVLPIQLHRSPNGPPGRRLTKLEKPIKDGTIFAHIKSLELAGVGVVVEGLWGDGGEEVDVVGGVEPADVLGFCGERAEDLHAAVEGVVDDEVVGHTDAVGFHWVALAVVVVAD